MSAHAAHTYGTRTLCTSLRSPPRRRGRTGVCVSTCVRVHVCVFACACVCARACVSVCVCVCVDECVLRARAGCVCVWAAQRLLCLTKAVDAVAVVEDVVVEEPLPERLPLDNHVRRAVIVPASVKRQSAADHRRSLSWRHSRAWPQARHARPGGQACAPPLRTWPPLHGKGVPGLRTAHAHVEPARLGPAVAPGARTPPAVVGRGRVHGCLLLRVVVIGALLGAVDVALWRDVGPRWLEL